jgi:hypothetical protein
VFFPIALTIGVVILLPGKGAQAAPTAISACQPISQPGSYVLTTNIVASGDCLVIALGVDAVTIDLAGFSISGNGTGTGIRTSVPQVLRPTRVSSCRMGRSQSSRTA